MSFLECFLALLISVTAVVLENWFLRFVKFYSESLFVTKITFQPKEKVKHISLRELRF